MGRKPPSLRRESRPLQRAFHLALKLQQRRRLLDADPQHAGAELTDARERQLEARSRQAQERRIDIARQSLIDLADEAERHMKVAGVHPTRLWHAEAEGGKPELQRGRQVDTDE